MNAELIEGLSSFVGLRIGDLMLVAPNLDHPAAMSKLSFAAG
jgi:hypothetical protein